jgi:phosphatidylinositol alpha-mannosyltransferase
MSSPTADHVITIGGFGAAGCHARGSKRELSSSDALRICVVVPYDLADAGGVKHHAVQLARALREQGHEVTLLGPSSQPSSDPKQVVTDSIVSVPSNGSDNRVALFGVRKKLKRFLEENTFDLIHVHEPPIPSLSYWISWLTPHVPKMATFHAFSESPSLGIRALQHVVASILYPHFDHAVAVSPPAARHAKRTWSRPLPVIPNGIPLQIFAPSLRQAPRRSTRRILSIGKLSDERKGIATMVEAFKLLRAEDLSCTLDLIGDGPGRPGLPSVEGLRFYAPMPLGELVERYRACDVFVAPSTGQESFGIVLLEAMAAGKPIVCSDIEGYRHVARPEGASFVPPRNPVALANAIRAILEDEQRRRTISAFNLRHVRRYDWSVVARDVVREYQVTIENHRIRRGLSVPGVAADFVTTSEPRSIVSPRHSELPTRADERDVGT